MISEHDILKAEQKHVKMLSLMLEQMKKNQEMKLNSIGERQKIYELQNDYLKSCFLENEQKISKIKRMIENEAEKLELSEKEVQNLYLAKQVQFYDQKMIDQQIEHQAAQKSHLSRIKEEREEVDDQSESAAELIKVKEKLKQTLDEKDQLLKLEVMMIEQLKLKQEKQRAKQKQQDKQHLFKTVQEDLADGKEDRLSQGDAGAVLGISQPFSEEKQISENNLNLNLINT